MNGGEKHEHIGSILDWDRKYSGYGGGWGDGEWMRGWIELMKKAGTVLVGDECLIANEAPHDGALAECRAAGKDLTESA